MPHDSPVRLVTAIATYLCPRSWQGCLASVPHTGLDQEAETCEATPKSYIRTGAVTEDSVLSELPTLRPQAASLEAASSLADLCWEADSTRRLADTWTYRRTARVACSAPPDPRGRPLRLALVATPYPAGLNHELRGSASPIKRC
jgi:hypothetical protein